VSEGESRWQSRKPGIPVVAFVRGRVRTIPEKGKPSECGRRVVERSGRISQTNGSTLAVPEAAPGPPSAAEWLPQLATLPPIYSLLPPPVEDGFSRAAARAAIAYLQFPSEKPSLTSWLFPRSASFREYVGGSVRAVKRLAVYPLVAWPNADATKRTARDEVVTATCRVETGRLGNAARTLQNSDRVAIASEEVIQTLRDQHIQGDPHPLGDDLAFASASIPTEEAIRAALDSFVREVSPGLSGWTVSLLKIALRTDPFLKFLQHLTAAIAKGTTPGQRLLCAARLTPIDKADGGIRPIACGDLIYRFLCMKAILSANFSSDFLLPNQLGVLSKGGIEPIALIQRAVDGDLGRRSFAYVAQLDFKNASNSLPRSDSADGVRRFAPALYQTAKWAYNTPTDLLIRTAPQAAVSILSSQGVRQGDPLGPLIFSIGIRDLLDGLIAFLGEDHLLLAYLDDVFILRPDSGILDRVLPHLNGRSSPISLNPVKEQSH